MAHVLYHWSESDASDFEGDPATFEVNTQGHVYCIDGLNRTWGTTKSLRPRSLLIFVGDAAKLFRKHPFLTVTLFKRVGGQYWTRRFGDLRWSKADSQRYGNVWIVRRATTVRIACKARRRKQVLKRTAAMTLDVAVAAAAGGAAAVAFMPSGILHQRFVYLAGMAPRGLIVGIVVTALASILVLPLFVRRRPTVTTSGEPWDPETETKAALENAERDGFWHRGAADPIQTGQ